MWARSHPRATRLTVVCWAVCCHTEGTSVKYSGAYAGGQKNGLGQIWYPNGDRYYGLWEANKKSGEGTYYYKNGDVYSGNWANDVKSGSGTYVFAKDRSQLVGDWANGTLTSGKWVFEDGTSYHGQFRNNKPIGKGVFYFPNGNQQEVRHTACGWANVCWVPRRRSVVWLQPLVVARARLWNCVSLCL